MAKKRTLELGYGKRHQHDQAEAAAAMRAGDHKLANAISQESAAHLRRRQEAIRARWWRVWDGLGKARPPFWQHPRKQRA